MGRFLFLTLVLGVLFSSVVGQRKLREVDISVNGVKSGSTYTAVLKRFGRPTKHSINRTEAEHACSASEETYRTLDYPGIRIELLEAQNDRKPTVVAMEVTSSKWSASGIRTGATPTHVRQKFGKPVTVDRKAGKTIYYYVTPDNLGGVNFEFFKGKLVSILMNETLC